MKINGYNAIPPFSNRVQTSLKDLDPKVDPKKKDHVEISSEAKQMQTSPRIAQERADKVSDLKNKVETGTYQIKPEEIAKKMLAYWNK